MFTWRFYDIIPLIKNVKKLDSQLQEREEELNLLQEQIAKTKKELEALHQIKVKVQTLAELEEKLTNLENLWQRKQTQLEEDFNQEKAMLAQKHQASLQLLGQQIKLLTDQLNQAHQRIKELAVAALEAKRPREEKSASE